MKPQQPNISSYCDHVDLQKKYEANFKRTAVRCSHIDQFAPFYVTEGRHDDEEELKVQFLG